MKDNKVAAILSCLASVGLYFCAFVHFTHDNINMVVIYMTLGSTFLCLGGVYLNKSKKQ